jgi:hypothetical protein
VKKHVLIIALIALALPAYSLTFMEYFSHINFSLGVGFFGGGDVDTDDYGWHIELSDNKGNFKIYNYPLSDIETSPVGLSLNFRIPFYFNRIISTGFTMDMGLSGDYFTGVIGGYVEGHITERFSLLGGIGGSVATLTPEVGKFLGDRVVVSGSSASGLGFYGAAKFHIFKYVFFEGGYRFTGKQKVSDWKVKVDGEEIPGDINFPPLDVLASHCFSMKIGIGI